MVAAPEIDTGDLNLVTAVLGAFMTLYGLVSVKIKEKWYLGEALPALLLGVALGPVAAGFLVPARWGSGEEGQVEYITLGVARIVIGVQLVIAGYQLPSRYAWNRLREIVICLLPVMTLMWLLTTGCILATTTNLTLLSALTIAACVTPTDPILSQAIAKGPFSDKYVARPLREIISAEAIFNDGFGFPYLMLAVLLQRHPPGGPGEEVAGLEEQFGEGGYLPQVGGTAQAIEEWVVGTWIYIVVLGVVYGAVCGFLMGKGIGIALKRKWIDNESYVLFPVALALFVLGTANAIGTNDILGCACAGAALNWDGAFLEEVESRHDEVNTCIDVILNFGGFMYIGTVIPWSDFHDPDGSGVTIWRLFLLGLMVIFLRRIPAIFAVYKFMPRVVTDWKEALFMGYFGPIGIGAVFYLEDLRHLLPEPEEGTEEQNSLTAQFPAIVYFLVVFSIVVHGLSIPALNLVYRRLGVKPVQDDAVEMRRKSAHISTPPNAVAEDDETFVAFNRFRRPSMTVSSRRVSGVLPFVEPQTGRMSQSVAPAAMNGEMSDTETHVGSPSMDEENQKTKEVETENPPEPRRRTILFGPELDSRVS